MRSDPIPLQASPQKTRPAGSVHRHLRKVPLVASALMILLAIAGVAITVANFRNAKAFWIGLMPVYALLCIFTVYYYDGRTNRMMVVRQGLHRLGIGFAIYLDLAFLHGSGEQTSIATGLSSLLLLALGCYLAGVYVEWPFAVVGVFLSFTLVVLIAAQEYMLLLVGVGIVLLAAMLATHKWLKPTKPKRTF